MTSLLNNLAAIQSAIMSILQSAEHVDNLYSARDIYAILRITVDSDNTTAVDIDANSHLMIHTFNFEQQK